MNPAVELIMEKYDEKTKRWLRRGYASAPRKSTGNFSYFSNVDELNNGKKRVRGVAKRGETTPALQFLLCNLPRSS